MNPNYPYLSNGYPFDYSYQTERNYGQYPYGSNRNYSAEPSYLEREKPIKGEATWTDGGKITKCNIPWSEDHYMTAGVGANSPYKCGEMLLVKNLANQKEIRVKIVDEVHHYPANRITLHRKAFEALGAKLDEGVIHIEMMPVKKAVTGTERGEWGNYLLSVTRAAFPQYTVTGYRPIYERYDSPSHVQETFDYFLQSQSGTKIVRGNVLFDAATNQVLSIDLKEF